MKTEKNVYVLKEKLHNILIFFVQFRYTLIFHEVSTPFLLGYPTAQTT